MCAIRKDIFKSSNDADVIFCCASPSKLTPLFEVLMYLIKCICVNHIYKYSTVDERSAQWEQLRASVLGTLVVALHTKRFVKNIAMRLKDGTLEE